MKPYIICSHNLLKHPVGYTSMQMHMPVERRAKPVLKRDRAKPGTGLPGGAAACRNACRVAKQPFDLVQKNARQRRHRLWPVGQHTPQPLRDGDHPLPNRDRRHDMVCQVRSRLSHPPTRARRTDPAALTRKRNQKTLATATAPCPCKPETEQSTGKIPAELRLNMAADWLAVGIVHSQPTLEVLGDDCIERCPLWSATDIPLPRCLTPPHRWQPLAWRLLAGRNHGAARLSEMPPLSKASAATIQGNDHVKMLWLLAATRQPATANQPLWGIPLMPPGTTSAAGQGGREPRWGRAVKKQETAFSAG